MKQPLVSVVIPTFERPVYLKRAIESVLRQTYPNLELIIVIDGQSEATKEVVKHYQRLHKMRIECIETSTKVGGSEARNIGAKKAQGKLVALLDDDDEWLPEKIAIQLERIEQEQLMDEEAFLCFTTVFVYDSIDQAEYNQLPMVAYASAPSKKIADYLFETKGFSRIGWIQTSSILVPKQLLLSVPFTTGLPKHQDWDWLLKLNRETNLSVVQVEKALTIYHSDVPKDNRVGVKNQWRFSEKWLLEHHEDFSQNGFDSFLLDILLPGVSSDHSLTQKERAKEMRRLWKKLSLQSYIRMFTWKMVLFFLVRNNDFLFKSFQQSLLLTKIRKKFF